MSRLIFIAFETPSRLTEVLSIVTENLSRHTNPHVVRAAVQCMRVLGGGYVDGCICQVGVASALNTCGMAWRTLLLDGIHMVANSVHMLAH